MKSSSLRQGGFQIFALLSTSVLVMAASLAPLSHAHAADNAQSPKGNAKPSASAKTTKGAKPVAAPKPDIDFRGVLLGVPGQMNALKALCLRDANERLAEAAKHVEDPSINLGKLTYKQMSEPQQRLSITQHELELCEKEIKAGAKGGSIFSQFRMAYANLLTMFSLKSSDDGAILQLSGNVTEDTRAPLMILLRERFGTPEVKAVTYQNRAGARYNFDTLTWTDEKSNTVELAPNDDLSFYLLVFKAGIVAEKRVDQILDSVGKGRSKM
jgi:hypothetical protein